MAEGKKVRRRYPKFHKDGTLCTVASDFPAIAKEWDYERNENPPSAYAPGSNYKAYWHCPKDHVYQTTIAKRTMRRDGCPYCSGRKALAGFNDLLTLMPQIAIDWHTEKNEIEPYEVRPGCRKKVWWICPNCGHEYLAEIANRTIHHSACPKCRYQRSAATRTKKMKQLIHK